MEELQHLSVIYFQFLCFLSAAPAILVQRIFSAPGLIVFMLLSTFWLWEIIIISKELSCNFAPYPNVQSQDFVIQYEPQAPTLFPYCHKSEGDDWAPIFYLQHSTPSLHGILFLKTVLLCVLPYFHGSCFPHPKKVINSLLFFPIILIANIKNT